MTIPRLQFRHLAILSSMLCFTLAIMWLLAPTTMLANWGVSFDGATGVAGRRAAPLYAGISVMLYVARNASPSPARTALVAGLVTMSLLLAVLGVVEWGVGHVNAGILSAILVELALALAFLLVARADRAEAQRRF